MAIILINTKQVVFTNISICLLYSLRPSSSPPGTDHVGEISRLSNYLLFPQLNIEHNDISWHGGSASCQAVRVTSKCRYVNGAETTSQITQASTASDIGFYDALGGGGFFFLEKADSNLL